MIRFLTNQDGRRTHAVIPIDDYDRMTDRLRDSVDAADAERTLADLERGAEQLIPANVASRLLEEHPVKVWREYRRMNQSELAAAAGISSAYLSQIESGTRNGSKSVLMHIAEALGVDREDIAEFRGRLQDRSMG